MLLSVGQGVSRASRPGLLLGTPWRLASAGRAAAAVTHATHSSPPGVWASARQQKKQWRAAAAAAAAEEAEDEWNVDLAGGK